MTKADLIAQMAKSTGSTKADSERALNAFLTIAKGTIRREGRLPLAGFGTFVVVNRKARTGRNPQTGQPIQIRATRVVRFRTGKELKASIG